MIIHDVEQGTNEWLAIKAGKFGGTSAQLFTVGSGISAGLQTAIYDKAAQLVQGPTFERYASDAMLRGVALEPQARRAYEMATFQDVTEVGFIQVGDYFGVSPDGLVGEDGLIEIKCPGGKEYVRWMVESSGDDLGAIPKGYYLQMQWAMLITGRTWCDYVVYHPEFAPLDLSITRVYPAQDVFDKFTHKMELVKVEMNRVLSIVAQKEEV